MLQLNDQIAIADFRYDHKDTYKSTVGALIIIFDFWVLCAFAAVYLLLVLFINKHQPVFQFLKCQVHAFFVVVILVSLGRILNSVALVAIKQRNFKQKKQPSLDEIQKLEMFNILTECIFNLFICYYFVEVSKSKESLNRRVSLMDQSELEANILYEDQAPLSSASPPHHEINASCTYSKLSRKSELFLEKSGSDPDLPTSSGQVKVNEGTNLSWESNPLKRTQTFETNKVSN